MLEVYLNHDIFLISSRYEGFGLVTLEAMECGFPVIGFELSKSIEKFSFKIIILQWHKMLNENETNKKSFDTI